MNEHLLAIFNSFISFFPLSIIGIWRWSVWGAKRISAMSYHAQGSQIDLIRRPTVSIVVPVYNEDPEIFELALQSWIANRVDEIVAVIDASNQQLITDYYKRYVPRKDVSCRLLVTPKPGKRAALADGIEQATSEVIALVDSDVIWHQSVLDYVLPQFLQPNIGGVGTVQRVYQPKTVTQILFDIILWTRYYEEIPFLLGAGHVFNTLSGRTAFYRREVIFDTKSDMLYALTHEFFAHSRCVSGDDKRLTHLVLEEGWHLGFAKQAIVYTPGAKDMRTFLKQRLRWTRNSWRADTRAFQRKWVMQHPALAYHNFDRFIQPFVMLLGPIAFVIALANYAWIIAGIIVAWWFVSRFIKLFGYFRENPKKILYLPAYIIFSYYNSLMKIYAWGTILEQGWITRWDAARLKKRNQMIVAQGWGLTITVLVGLVFAAIRLHDFGQAWRQPIQTRLANEFPGTIAFEPDSPPPQEPPLPPSAQTSDSLIAYTVTQSETIEAIAERSGLPVDQIRYTNYLNKNQPLEAGQIIYAQSQIPNPTTPTTVASSKITLHATVPKPTQAPATPEPARGGLPDELGNQSTLAPTEATPLPTPMPSPIPQTIVTIPTPNPHEPRDAIIDDLQGTPLPKRGRIPIENSQLRGSKLIRL